MLLQVKCTYDFLNLIFSYFKIEILFSRLGLFRDAEKQYSSAIKQQPIIDSYLYLSKVYVKLDKPLNSIAKLKEANEIFSHETTILQGIARIYEVNLIFNSCHFKIKKIKYLRA